MTIEEGAAMGGFGSAVLEWFAAHGVYGIPIRLMGIRDTFIEHGSIDEQRAEVGLTADQVAETVKSFHPAKQAPADAPRLMTGTNT